jgi:uncharacterized protein (TIGR01370 family)
MLRRGALVAGLAVLATSFALARGAESTAGGTPELTSWAFAIGNGQLKGSAEEVAARLGEFDLVVVDGQEAKPAELDALRARGTTTLGYLSVGTIEKWRPWYRKLKRFRLNAWQDWKDEWFADVSKRKLRRFWTQRVAPKTLRKGFDGLFLDNVDMVDTRNHRHQRKGMRKLVRKLSRLTHDRGALLFAQNGHGIVDRLGLVPLLDGWNREDATWTFDFDRRRYVRQRRAEIARAQDELADFAARGLIVTATDYTKAGDDEAVAESIANACEAGALPYVSNIGLTAKRLPQPPLTCD